MGQATDCVFLHLDARLPLLAVARLEHQYVDARDLASALLDSQQQQLSDDVMRALERCAQTPLDDDQALTDGLNDLIRVAGEHGYL